MAYPRAHPWSAVRGRKLCTGHQSRVPARRACILALYGVSGQRGKANSRPTRLESPKSIHLPRREFTFTAPAQKEARQPAPDPGFVSYPHPHTSHLHTSHQFTCLQHTHLNLHPAPHLCTLTFPHIPHLHTFIPHPQLHRSHLYPIPQTCTHHICITHPQPLTPLTCASPTHVT